MPLLDVVWIALLGILSGPMIGCIGIGGVILVPALVFLTGIAIQIAIPAAMFAYILSGLVATFVFARNKSIDWRMAGSLCIGGTPAAFADAWAVSIFDGRVLAGCLGLLSLLSGLNSLRPRIRAESDHTTLSHGILFIVGAATGFLSSLTGTGGPLVLVPILLSMRLGVLASVGLSQIFQLPVAIAATAGNIIYSKLDLALGVILAASLSGGSWFGAKVAHAVPRATLRGIVSSALVLIGLFILANVGWRLLDEWASTASPPRFSIRRQGARKPGRASFVNRCGRRSRPVSRRRIRCDPYGCGVRRPCARRCRGLGGAVAARFAVQRRTC